MKKFLLGTTALVGVAAFAAGAHAEPTVSLGGYFDFQAGFADQDSPFDATGASSRDAKFANDTKVDVNVEGTSDNGLRYGSVIRLQADLNASADNNGLNAERTYLFVESNAGRVEAGSNLSAANNMKVDAATIARATGGIDGDWYRFVTLPGQTNPSAASATFITRPDLPLDANRGTTEDANKITYYSPRFSGFQVGVSFTPDSGDAGTYLSHTGDLNGDQENVFSVGANYRGQFDQVGIQASATGEFGSSEIAGTEDLSAFQVGAVVSYQGFSIAGSYGDWDDSTLPTAATGNNDQDYFTLGATYETGPFGVSVTYLNSERSDNDLDLVSVGADYQLAPGLVPYVEANFFDADAAGTTVDNTGTAVLVGTQLNF
ncbi:MAG: porin [Proteobacteria bacterium]|nr:porin [Pseudomonadota bacterium]